MKELIIVTIGNKVFKSADDTNAASWADCDTFYVKDNEGYETTLIRETDIRILLLKDVKTGKVNRFEALYNGVNPEIKELEGINKKYKKLFQQRDQENFEALSLIVDGEILSAKKDDDAINVVYPPMVEEAYNTMTTYADYRGSKQYIYNMLLSFGEIDENGEPTQQAYDNGYTKPTKIEKFKIYNPLFQDIPDVCFTEKNGEITVNQQLLRWACDYLLHNDESKAVQKDRAKQILEGLDRL